MNLFEYLNGYHLSVEQQAWVLRQLRDTATERGEDDLAKIFAQTLPEIAKATAVERSFASGRGTQGTTEEITTLDTECDDLVGTIHDTLRARSRGRKRRERARRVAALLEEAFPTGLGSHVGSTREVKVERSEELITLLRSDRWSDLVADLGLTSEVADLDASNGKLRRKAMPTQQVTWEDVLAAARHTEDVMLQAIFRALGTFDVNDPDAVARRDELLHSYVAMQDRVRQAWKRRHAKGQGEEPEPEPQEPTPEPAAPEVDPEADPDEDDDSAADTDLAAK